MAVLLGSLTATIAMIPSLLDLMVGQHHTYDRDLDSNSEEQAVNKLLHLDVKFVILPCRN